MDNEYVSTTSPRPVSPVSALPDSPLSASPQGWLSPVATRRQRNADFLLSGKDLSGDDGDFMEYVMEYSWNKIPSGILT